MAGAPPPPPPPMAFGSLSSSHSNGSAARPAPGALPDTNALLGDIRKGTRLKKAVTNDRSAPQTGGRVLDEAAKPSSSSRSSGAPPVPGNALRPPMTPGANSNESSFTSQNDSAPQPLAGIFAQGMPKLRHRGGGVNTGADDSSFTAKQNTESYSTNAPPSLPHSRPPRVPSIPSSRPTIPDSMPPSRPPAIPDAPASKLPPKPPVPSPGMPKLRHVSSPTGSSPAVPSMAAPPVPGSANQSAGRLAPPVPPPGPPSRNAEKTSRTPSPSNVRASPEPPTTPSSASRMPKAPSPGRSVSAASAFSATPPPPPPPPPPPFGESNRSSLIQELSSQKSFSNATPPKISIDEAPTPPRAPPPPPMSHSASSSVTSIKSTHSGHSAHSSAPNVPPPPPPPASSGAAVSSTSPFSARRTARSNPPPPPSDIRKMDASAYTITASNGRSNGQGGQKLVIDDKRFKFKNKDSLPQPRKFQGKEKFYPSGRGSSVPLDISVFD